MLKTILAVILTITTLGGALAQANTWTNLLEITTDLYPGLKFYLGIDVGDDQQLKAFYYSDPNNEDEDERYKGYPISTLNKSRAVITQYGMDFARIKYANNTLTFSYKDNFKSGNWHDKYLYLDCGAGYKNCSFIDYDSKARVSKGHVQVAQGKVFGSTTTVGIKTITTR